MKPKGQVSKFSCTNTVTSSRTLVKSRKVFQKDSPKAVLGKADLKHFTKNSPKRDYYEFLSSVTSQPATSLKKNTFSEYFFMSEHW